MRKIYSILGALLMGATSLFAQTNYTVTFSANVEMDGVQVKNLSSDETVMLYSPDNVITLQKVEKQGTPIASVDKSMFLQQTANNEVVVNMEKTGHLILTLYSLNGTFVARYSYNVDAGQNTFQIGASSGMYVLVASANNQTASLKIMLTQSMQLGILEVLTERPEPLLKSLNDVITFNEGDAFEFTGYYYSQISKKTAVITANMEIEFSFIEATPPTISTVQATNVTTDAATIDGYISNDNGVSVFERGICWGTTSSPTIADNKKMSGSGIGSFTVSLSSLSDGTTYYVRAYAISEVGTTYGNEISFTTEKVITVSTEQAINITTDAATINCIVTSNNGTMVTEYGICWGTSSSPTIADNKKMSGSGTGSFTVSLSSLSDGTTYYVRTYAISEVGITYGNEISFTTEKIIIGAIKATFSVSENRKVYFSQGNLQYQASSNIWRFAENQYDMIGADNSNISSTYSEWIDLFGWGTSGWKFQPYCTSRAYTDYYVGGSASNNLVRYANADWGVYNKISNGGNQVGQWRTLTIDQWFYLIHYRANASSLMAIATVNDVMGLILLPDDWVLPDGLTFSSDASTNFAQNTYTITDWNKMEEHGAVFLPAAGSRYGTGVGSFNVEGYYWSSSAKDDSDARCLFINSEGVHSYSSYRCMGHSVRLVQYVE